MLSLWISAVSAACAIGVMIYARRNTRIADRALKLAEQRFRTDNSPCINVYAAFTPDGVVHIIVENVGRTPAFDVEFHFTPDLLSLEESGAIAEPLARGMKCLGPSQRLAFYWGWITRGDDCRTTAPIYEVLVTYGDSPNDGADLKYRGYLDLRAFEGALLAGSQSDLARLTSAVQSLERRIGSGKSGAVVQ